MSAPHHEHQFERYIVDRLVEQGWLEGTNAGYDLARALYPEDVVGWIETTQPDKWQKLLGQHGRANAGKAVLDRLARELKKNGTPHVIKRGIQIAGAGIVRMSESAPEDARQRDVVERYRANRLRVVPQLRYHPTRPLAIDLVLFINGIPVSTVEVKTDFTQSAEAAMEQYMNDRPPREGRLEHPLLTFKRGAVVHFAVSDSDIRMTTRLDGTNTTFLPFNQGNGEGAGNPAREDGEYPVAYFWERVLQPDAWLRVFHRFVYVEKKTKLDRDGVPRDRETLIFPRFHQWEAVTRVIDDAQEKGAGHAYLLEHSAGSGKTSTIAWTAHDLIRLRDRAGAPHFNSVIVVSDRNVLDKQLQDAVRQIDQQKGVVETIDAGKSGQPKSRQLAESLRQGTPIIVVTLQTFPHALEAIATDSRLSGKNFAVIVDEAHTSQTGDTAAKVKTALSADAPRTEDGIESYLQRMQESRARPSNVSYFAFTATPKHATLQLFGRPADETAPPSGANPPRAFHRYTMRQAIEEGFILDVLQNYTAYKTAYTLQSALDESERVDSKQARRALARWTHLHPTNVTQKVEFIVRHFHTNVAGLLNGQAKAMVVTSSRAAAVKYKHALDRFVRENPDYGGIRALVAFSDRITGREVNHAGDALHPEDPLRVPDDAEYTEASMNPDVPGSDLRTAFDGDDYNVMIVANKFQTGFDQPRLMAMYLDKSMSGIEAVQTLSRMNRTFPGKDQTFAIDFVNDPETIRAAFAAFYDGARIEDVQDPNVVYEIKDDLDAHGIYSEDDIANFKRALARAGAGDDAGPATHRALYAATQRPADVFNTQLREAQQAAREWESTRQRCERDGDDQGASHAEARREAADRALTDLGDFKSKLGRLSRVYAYVTQLIDFGDPDLENFALFAKLLAKRLEGVAEDRIDLRGLAMTRYAIVRAPGQNGAPDDGEETPGLTPVGSGELTATKRKRAYIQELVEKINEIFGEIADPDDQRYFVARIAEQTAADENVAAQIAANPREHALDGDLEQVVLNNVIRASQAHNDMANHLLQTDNGATRAFIELIYEVLTNSSPEALMAARNNPDALGAALRSTV